MVDVYINVSSLEVTLTQDNNLHVIPAPSGGGITDHGALDGLDDDDHSQYHNDTRGDARYYLKTAVDTALSGKSDTGHNHDSAYAAADHNHDSDYAAAVHAHDGSYYTKAQIDTLLAGVGGGATIDLDVTQIINSNSTAEEDVFSKLIPADSIGDDKEVEIYMAGWIRNNSGATINQIIRFYLNSTEVWGDQTNTFGSDNDEIGWHAELKIHWDGITGGQKITGLFYIGREYSPMTGFAGEIGSDEVKGHASVMVFSSEDNTADMTFKMTVDQSYASVNNQFVLEVARMELKG